jgi:hypothetical protein
VSPDPKNEVVQECSACIHYRKATPIDPLAGWHVLSSKIFELLSKWEKHMVERAMWEQQRFESGLGFDYEPQTYPYCGHFTDEFPRSPNGKPELYILCAEKNPPDKNKCEAFKTAGDPQP